MWKTLLTTKFLMVVVEAVYNERVQN